MAFPSRIRGDKPENTVANVDFVTNGLVLIDSVHAAIHRGIFFQSDVSDETVANDGTLLCRIATAVGGAAHLRWRVAVGGDVRLEFIEDPTVDTAGEATTAYNRNRRSSLVPTSSIFKNPTITGGTVIGGPAVIPGGGVFISGGGQQESFLEWVLKADEDYVLRVTNISGAAQPLTIAFDWYEPFLDQA